MNFKHSKILAIFFILFVINTANAQDKSEYTAGEVIIQLEKSFTDINSIVKRNTNFEGNKTELEVVEQLSDILNIWLLRFNHENVNHTKFINYLALNKNIIEYQNNHIIDQRATKPNDTHINKQWQYINNGGSGGIVDADIDADLAWDITTGGVTPLGDTIVVCIVDDGLFKNQPDFEDNLWVNRGEIEGNGIDDDGNGYVDDYKGYFANHNTPASLDNIYATSYSHGTAVAGIVGAKGNNNLGVAGINWNVKLMIVKNYGASESQVIKAYNYPLKMRKLYNETNGTKGAFVVAVNSSWGIDYAKSVNFPIWCAFYDEMGAAGILNAAATTNSNTNVDVGGDMPTTCASEYLITVTNVWRDDQKVNEAGYGATSIDLGAFGEGAYTISDSNPTGYAAFGGTSGATPQVAGAIALLYSAPCPSFANLYTLDPAAAALKAKEHILNGGDANTSLQGITTSGKRLNLFGMLNELNLECNSCPSLTEVFISDINDKKVIIDGSLLGSTDSLSFVEVRYRVLGETEWNIATSPDLSITINNLDPQSNYQYQVRLICDSYTSEYTETNLFSTAPLSINKLAIQNGIKVYPNPTKDIVYISLDELQSNFEITFYDISGKLIYEGKMYTQKKKIDISVLQSGIYILKLKDENGNVFTHKINKI